MRAIVVDPDASGRLVIRDIEDPMPTPSEALVKVAAISLNRGEVRRAHQAEAGWRPGWDLAGTLEQAAADGSGPKEGARVVGLMRQGAWAEQVSVPTNALAELPEPVTFAQAASLPVAGLTALRSLEKGGLLTERRVLVTGASGGVGHFACALGKLSGAHIVGAIRTANYRDAVLQAGAEDVVTGEELRGAERLGPFDLALDSVGGKTLAKALTLLAPGGTCVVFGSTAGQESTVHVPQFYVTGGLTLYGFFLFYEHVRNPVGPDLSRLARLVASGRLNVPIEVEAPWAEIAEVAQKLTERAFTGKAVLHIT
jgi:NADPH2:quinone reductase